MTRATRSLEGIDPTGAGDAFMAGVIAEIVHAKHSIADRAFAKRCIDRGVALARAWLLRR
jgi:sugar/nucleoside kinase (ribokinase family)